MNSFTMRKLLWMAVIMAAMPFLGRCTYTDLGIAGKKDFRAGISNGIAAAVHKKIALNYWKEADRLDAEVKDFMALGEVRRKSALIYEQRQPTSSLKASLDRGLADHYEKMAQEARDLAEMHEEMARSLSEEGRPAKSTPQQSAPAAPCAGGKFVD